MSLAALVRKMVDAGAPSEAIAIAVEAIEARDAVEAQRKAKDAFKTALYRKRGGGAITEELRQIVYKRDGYACVYCGSGDNLTCDHVLAVSRGGATTEDNLATACSPCNSRKRDRDRKYVQRHSSDINGHSLDTAVEVGGSPQIVSTDPPPKKEMPHTPKEKTPPPGSQSGCARDFAAFWEIWPHRVGKAEAERSFRGVAKRSDSDLPSILAGVRRYISNKPPDQNWLNPATFLNQRRWEDEPGPAPEPRKSNGTHGGSVSASLRKLDFGPDDVIERPPPLFAKKGEGAGGTADRLLPPGRRDEP